MVALTSQPTAAVTLTVTTLDSNRLYLTNALFTSVDVTRTLMFTSTNWDTPQPMNLVPVRDADAVENTVVLRHAATGGDYRERQRRLRGDHHRRGQGRR